MSGAPEPTPEHDDSTDAEVVLSVRDLEVSFGTKRGRAEVVRGLDYDLHRGETLAIVGESGSGKSVSTLALTKLIPIPPGRVTGTAHLGDTDLISLSEAELVHVRGQRIGFVFQDPMTSLNPVHTIGRQLTEGMRHHLGLSEAAARDRAVELLAKVGIPSPEDRLGDYPHQFSGGMAQRAMIALSLCLSPKLILADEPTTALDVVIQDRILETIKEMQAEYDSAMILITHDISVVSETSDRIAVCYAGRIVEQADAATIIKEPRHPYTLGLRNAFPDIGDTDEELISIPGTPPDLVDPDEGCRFAPRCPFAEEECWQVTPPPEEFEDGHVVRCHRADEAEELRERAERKETWLDGGDQVTPPLSGGDE